MTQEQKSQLMKGLVRMYYIIDGWAVQVDKEEIDEVRAEEMIEAINEFNGKEII